VDLKIGSSLERLNKHERSSTAMVGAMNTNKKVQIDVGGTLFTTTLDTLQSAGKDSKLYRQAWGRGGGDSPAEEEDCFFDRDPETFKVLLNLLRTGKVNTAGFDGYTRDKVIEEATYYGLLEKLKNAMAPAQLNGLDLQKAKAVIPNGIDIPTALAAGGSAATEDGSLWVAHGSKITVYDWALRKQKTTLTEFSSIEILNRMSDTLVAAGASDMPGLHIYDPINGMHKKSVIWTDENDPRVYNPVVRAIASNDSSVFASFESGQKLDNALAIIDKTTLQITREFGRQNGATAHAKASTKLQWLASKSLLLVASVQGGSFGYAGYMRLWDIRSEKLVWDWKEPNFQSARAVDHEMFSDMTADEGLQAIFKVSITSGSVSMADLRHLETKDPWIPLLDTNPVLEKAPGGADNKLCTYNKQLYLSRGADVEVWSEIPLAESFKDPDEKEYWDTSFRRNLLENSRHGAQEVTQMVAAADRLFITRKHLQGVEVWETR
jgi:hypothetical protein